MLSPHDQTTPPLLIVGFGAAVAAIALSFGWPGMGSDFFARVERIFACLAKHHGLSVLAVGMSVLVLRLAILPLYGIPLPFVPNDFSFLLAAETFAHGRLTNPTPPLWTHFETIHETMIPTYQSMYFPGQGLLLAAGQILFHNPWFAVLISSALMCAALTWALQAWLPANWALLGGFIAVLRIGVFSYWTNTYQAAGSLAALAGALVLGSLPRLTRTPRLGYALLIGIGIGILALTRPYEGLLLSLCVGVALTRWMLRGKNRPSAKVLTGYAALCLSVPLCACAWLGYYDLKAFGKVTTLPYTVDRAQYAIAPYFVWQPPHPEPHYRHPEMRAFYHKCELDFYHRIHSPIGFLPYTLDKVGLILLFYAGFLFAVPLIMVRRVFLDGRIRFLVFCVLVLAAGSFIEIYILPHYVAPFTVAFYAIGLQAMRHLRVWKPEGKPSGLAMVRMLMFACVALAGLRVFAQPLHLAASEWPSGNWNSFWIGPEHYGAQRASIENRLDQLPGGQLAIVRYGPGHYPQDQWVYNRADLQSAKVIWAWDMGPAQNLKLIRYFRDRKAWLVEPDVAPVGLTPYSSADAQGGAAASRRAE